MPDLPAGIDGSVSAMLPPVLMLALLGVPEADGWRMQACVTLGYPTGRWGVAPRRPAHEVAFRNQWGTAPGFEVPAPLWHHEDEADRDRTGEMLVW